MPAHRPWPVHAIATFDDSCKENDPKVTQRAITIMLAEECQVATSSDVSPSGDALGKQAKLSPDETLRFELRILGPFELIDRASGDSVTVKSLKMRALLTFLAVLPGARVGRRQIAGLLWASVGESSALLNLRGALSGFRKTGPHTDILVADDANLALNLSIVAVDRLVLREARQRCDLDSLRVAAALYRGDFGHALEIDEEEFDQWLAQERVRAKDNAIEVHDALIRLLAANGDYREALEWANRLAMIDPYREETHRLVIATEEKVSGRASAMARFQLFKKALRDELDVAPEQVTLDLIESLGEPLDTQPASPPTEAVEGGVKQSFKTAATPPVALAPSPHTQRPRRHFLMIAAGVVGALVVATGGVFIGRMTTAPAAHSGTSGANISTADLLQLADSAYQRSRAGKTDPDAIRLYEAVLAREPTQLQALMGLSKMIIRRVSHQQSRNVAGDLARLDVLLEQARRQAPDRAEIVYSQGMLNKLRGQNEAALRDFEHVLVLEPRSWSAAAQKAHLLARLGHLEEGYQKMEAASPDIPPGSAAAEAAYIAGETALAAGHPQRAVTYLEMACNGNPTISRDQAMLAAALWMAGRHDEARKAARLSRELQPPYGPARMARRGGKDIGPSFKEARDRMVEAYRAALTPVSASEN